MTAERAAQLAAWVARLESEPEWTARLRATAASMGAPVSAFVVLIGAPEDFRRAAYGATLVRGFFVTLGWVSDVARELPSATLASMAEAERRASPGHAHALVFLPPLPEPVRFRVPSP